MSGPVLQIVFSVVIDDDADEDEISGKVYEAAIEAAEKIEGVRSAV